MLRTAMVLAVAVATMVVAPAPAQAADLEWDSVSSHTWLGYYIENCQQNYLPTAQGCYFSSGNWLAIADIYDDSMRAGIHWRTTSGRKGVCVQAHGQDSYVAAFLTGDWACKKNFSGAGQIQIQVGRCNGSAVNCQVLSNWRDWSGWSPWLPV